MPVPTARPLASKGKGVCLGCHAQFLDVLSPRQFMRDNRAGDDEGYWLLQIVIERCHECGPPFYERMARSAFEWMGHDMSIVRDICLTSKQHAEAVTSTSVGAVADAPERVHNGNIQLANMRANSITGDHISEDTLYKEAIFQIWPYIAALLSSKEADQSTFTNGWCCCSGRTAVLRSDKFIQIRKPKREAIVDVPPTITADEQIFGNAMESGIPYVKLVHDNSKDKGTLSAEDALAAKFGPTTKDKAFFDSTPENIDVAIDERITKKHVPMDLTDEQRDEIIAITDHFCEEIRDSDAVDRIASWLLFGDLKSKKWTLSRAEMALNVLIWQYNPEFNFSAAIKLEPMPQGKPPRMLIADGDAGAVMSALTIGVLERYLCRYYKHRTIKGKPKGQRMVEICRDAFELDPANPTEALTALLLENDGSAWDTCCKQTLRELTENRVLDTMFEKLYKFFTPYNFFQAARRKADTKQKYKLQINTNKVDVTAFGQGSRFTQDELAKALCKRRTQACIESIRRSGDRGTSILNWLMNLICWAWVLCGRGGAASIVHSNGKVCVDIFGTRRRFKIWLEGDDSLLWLSGRKFTKAEIEVLEQRWTQLGHRPKLFQRGKGDVAEFCGWKVVCTEYGLDADTAMPDVPRMLENCFYTTAKEAVQAAVAGETAPFGRVVGPALIARAGSIADRVPSVARWLTQLAGSFNGGEIVDEMFTRDDMFRLGVADLNELLPEWWKDDDPQKLLDTRYGSFTDNVNRQVSNSIATGGLSREADLAMRHGWVKTKSEWFDFVTCLEAINLTTPDEVYRKIVPAGMR